MKTGKNRITNNMKHVLPNSAMLPSPDDLSGKLQSLAMLETILMADWEMRFFSFNSKWGPGEMMASMRDGQGSEFFFLFNAAGVAGKIYCDGNRLGANAASALAEVPRDFSTFLDEPAFSINTATCYLWRHFGDRSWSVAPEGVVEIPLLAFVADQGEYYRTWAEDYYEVELDVNAVRAVFRQQHLTGQLVLSVNPKAEMEAVLADAKEIGYPH
jgi:hypothetical protein